MKRLLIHLMQGISFVHLTVQVMAVIIVVEVFIKSLEAILRYIMSLI